MSEETEIYEFGDTYRFRLDPARREFYRDGQLVPLRPQAFELLMYLVAHPGVAIPKKTLVKAIWGNQQTGSDGDDTSLRRLFSDVYQALEDLGDPKTTVTRKTNFNTFNLVIRQVPRPNPEDDHQQQAQTATDRSADQVRGNPPASKPHSLLAGFVASRRAKAVIGLAVVGILGLLLWDGLSFRPNLVVSARDVPMSFDPFVDQFSIQNQSSIDIPDLEFGCYGLHFHAEMPPMANPQTGVAVVPTTEYERSQVDEDDVAPYLSRDSLEPKGTVYIPCRGIIQVPYRFPPETPGRIDVKVIRRAEAQPEPEPKLKLTYGIVVVFVQYRLPFLPVHRRDSFRFKTGTGSDGKYHWMPVAQAVNNVVTEIHGHAASYSGKLIFGSEALTDVTGAGKP